MERHQVIIERLHAAGGQRPQLQRLADDLGVCARTVVREVEQLRLSGVTVTTHQGRGGGLALTGPSVSDSATSVMNELARALNA